MNKNNNNMKLRIHVPDNDVLNSIPNLEDHGATKLFDFSAPNDFSTRSVWEILDEDKFNALTKDTNLNFYLIDEQRFNDFEKMKITS